MNARNLSPFHKPGRHLSKNERMDPFDLMREDFEKMMGTYFRGWPFGTLATGEDAGEQLLTGLDMSETDESIEVDVDLPGFEEKDVDVTLSDRTLTISGKRDSESEKKDKNYHRVERSFGSVHRQVLLPADVDEDRIEAHLKNGVLKITLPKTAEAKDKVRKIKVHHAV